MGLGAYLYFKAERLPINEGMLFLKIHEYSWESQDRIRFQAKSWFAESQPKATVFLVHGLGEHLGRYEHVACLFAENGYDIFAFDLRGHGQSGGKRGHTPSYGRLLDDIGDFITHSDVRESGLRFLYGHSLGGNLALHYHIRKQAIFSGLVITSPLLRTAQPVSAFLWNAGLVLNKIWPSLTIDNKIDEKYITRDPEMLNKRRNDPLRHDKLSFGLGIEMIAAGEWLLTNAGEISIPMLLMHGSADQVTSPQASVELCKKTGAACTFKLWEGHYHEMQNDVGREKVLDFIVDWLNSKT